MADRPPAGCSSARVTTALTTQDTVAADAAARAALMNATVTATAYFISAPEAQTVTVDEPGLQPGTVFEATATVGPVEGACVEGVDY